jgi:hypothetical protein
MTVGENSMKSDLAKTRSEKPAKSLWSNGEPGGNRRLASLGRSHSGRYVSLHSRRQYTRHREGRTKHSAATKTPKPLDRRGVAIGTTTSDAVLLSLSLRLATHFRIGET